MHVFTDVWCKVSAMFLCCVDQQQINVTRPAHRHACEVWLTLKYTRVLITILSINGFRITYLNTLVRSFDFYL